MFDPATEAHRWLEQAENDLAFAQHAHAGRFYHQVCFIGQQCAEKALKALHFRDGARTILGHSVVALLEPLKARHPAMAALVDLAAELDLFYIPTRYPNGLVEGTPHKVFTQSQAVRAMKAAEKVLLAVQLEIGAGENETKK